MIELHPIFLEVEGKKALAILPYTQYLEIEEQFQELEDIKALRMAKALEDDAPTISLAELRASYGLKDPQA